MHMLGTKLFIRNNSNYKIITFLKGKIINVSNARLDKQKKHF